MQPEKKLMPETVPAMLTVDLDYNRGRVMDENQPSNQALTFNYINHAVEAKYRDGLRPRDRRMYARLQEKLDEAVRDHSETIEVEKAEIDFLKDCFKDCRFPSQLSRFVVLLEDEIDRM